MKQKDIVLIVVIAIFSAVISLVLSNVVISSPKNRSQSVEVVDKITDEFTKPDEKYFNADSIDPTQLIQIGENTNQQPFNQ